MQVFHLCSRVWIITLNKSKRDQQSNQVILMRGISTIYITLSHNIEFNYFVDIFGMWKLYGELYFCVTEFSEFSIHNSLYIFTMVIVLFFFRKEFLTPAYWNSTKLLVLVPNIHYMYKRTGECCALKCFIFQKQGLRHCRWHNIS